MTRGTDGERRGGGACEKKKEGIKRVSSGERRTGGGEDRKTEAKMGCGEKEDDRTCQYRINRGGMMRRVRTEGHGGLRRAREQKKEATRRVKADQERKSRRSGS